MAIYLLISLLSLISCVLGFAIEVLQGNISHLQNGREPNAGAALFPTIPVVPCFYLLVAWAFNRAASGTGTIIVIIYFIVASPLKIYSLRKLYFEYKKLAAKHADNQVTRIAE